MRHTPLPRIRTRRFLLALVVGLLSGPVARDGAPAPFALAAEERGAVRNPDAGVRVRGAPVAARSGQAGEVASATHARVAGRAAAPAAAAVGEGPADTAGGARRRAPSGGSHALLVPVLEGILLVLLLLAILVIRAGRNR
jgi:hypothetical protein